HLGYGGLIHSFKNYVLRKDPVYLEALRGQLKEFSETVEEYRASGATQVELANLSAVSAAVAAYEAKIPIAMQAAEENWPPQRTDQLVKVDDRAAVQGLDALDAFWRDKRRETTQNIAAKVKDGLVLVDTGFKFLGGLLVVALALYGLFYWLQRQLRQSILRLSDELSERRAAEHTAKKFQRAVDQSPATIIITDTNHTIEYVNRKFTDLTGYSSSEVMGRTPAFLQSGDQPPEIYADLRQRLAQGEEWIGTFQNKKKSQDTYWARTAILPLRDDEGQITHYIGLGEDITERRKAREQMYRAQKMEAVGLLASGVAHDFNNVLTTILGNVFLAQQTPSRSPELAEELEQIEIAAKRARNLVNQVLTFARRQPGAADTLWVGDVLQEVSRLMRASVLPNVEIVCEEVAENLVVHADETRLHQVVMNLCSNAAEAIGTQGGEVVLSAELSDEGGSSEQVVVIRVTDTGPGVPDEVVGKIFDPFFTTKQSGKGTGLGLSVVANLVSEMGGEVKLAETGPQGTTFELALPLSTEPLRREVGPDELKEGSGHILLVDDEPEVVATCAKILRRLKYEVDV
ncbi:MAG: ATP-binding protein, partial [Pseudomonadota bacterium]